MSADSVNDLIAKFIRNERKKRGLRIIDMVRLSGIPLGSYGCLEMARFRFSPENLLRIQVALRCPIQTLWPFGQWRVEHIDDEVIGFIVGETAKLLPTPPTIDDVLEAVWHVTGFEADALASGSRKHALARARAIAAWLVSKHPKLRINDLAKALYMNPSSLSWAVARADERAAHDPEWRALLESARKWLKRVVRDG